MENQSNLQKSKNIYLSVIIPAYNEEKRIGRTLEAIDKFLRDKNYPYEIIVVEAGSSDKTAELVQNYAKSIPNLRFMKAQSGIFKGNKVKEGMLAAKGKYRLFTDADNATPIEEAEKLLPFFEQGYEVVIGSRAVDRALIKVHQPFYREFLGCVGNTLIQTLAVPGIKDTQCGFKCFTAKAAEDIFSRLTIMGWGFDIEVLVLANLKKYGIKEVPVVWINDPNSTVSAGAYFTTLRELFKIKLNLITKKYG